MTRDELAERVSAAAKLTFSRSGGQNVNKVNTQVTAHIPIGEIGLSDQELERVRDRLSNRISNDGELVLRSSESRSQQRNRERVIERAVHLIDSARRPTTLRRPTRPGRAAKERRLAQKKARAERKWGRRPPSVE